MSLPPRDWAVGVATGFYLSYIPFNLLGSRRGPQKGAWTGAGFVGTLIGWATLYALPVDPVGFSAVVVVGIALAVWLSEAAEKRLGTKDDSRIVVDEWVGYWVAVAFLPRQMNILLLGFVLFRIFDAFKLPPYKYLERLPGGWGIVMDDVGAGIVANIVLRCLLSAY